MRYVARVHDARLVAITVIPGWLGRLFGRRPRTVYAHRVLTEYNHPLWLTMAGRTVTGGMLDAIEGLPLTLPAIPSDI